jgi:hypothetical protein
MTLKLVQPEKTAKSSGRPLPPLRRRNDAVRVREYLTVSTELKGSRSEFVEAVRGGRTTWFCPRSKTGGRNSLRSERR